jgi:hypothetical protein
LSLLRLAPPAAVEEAEELAGRSLPSLLRRLNLEVGNDGCGPVTVSWASGTGTELAAWSRLPGSRAVSSLCATGVAASAVSSTSPTARSGGYDPNPVPDGVSCMFPQHMTIVDWFSRWVEGRLYQPWLVQDPTTGEWPGATDTEYAEMIEEAFGSSGPED